MGTIADLNRRVKSVNIRELFEKAVEDSADTALELNRSQLYNSSSKADGEDIMPYNGITYALMKNRMNPSPGLMKPDLYLSGDFHRGFFMTVKDYSYELDSRDSKSEELKEKYGEKIFGLTEDSKGVYAKGELFENVKELVTKQTGLEFK